MVGGDNKSKRTKMGCDNESKPKWSMPMGTVNTVMLP